MKSLTWPCDYEDNNDDKKSEIEDKKKFVRKICTFSFLFLNKTLNLIFLALDSKPRLRDKIQAA